MTERTERASANEAVADLGNEIMLLVEMIVEHAAPWLDGIIAAGHTGGLFSTGADSTSDAAATAATAATDGADADGADADAAAADPAQPASCGWCPLCAVVAMARGERPEFSARAIEQLAQLVGVLRAVLADRWYPGEGIHMPGAAQPERQDTGSAWTGARSAGARAPRPAASRAPRSAGGSASRAQRVTVRKAAAEPGEMF